MLPLWSLPILLALCLTGIGRVAAHRRWARHQEAYLDRLIFRLKTGLPGSLHR